MSKHKTTDQQLVTTNLTANNQNLAVLKRHFGQCFNKDGHFDFDKFKQEINATAHPNSGKEAVNFSKESYGIEWLGKSYARLLATDEATTLLKADTTHNALPEYANSQNLLLKGDNLEVLKHLSHAYYEQVKMIYIDPPYNTGSDGFVYADNRQFTAEQLEQLAGVSYEKAQQILTFTRSKTNSHSAWLTFMYPRLYIAKQLLREDGVIFVSIDDNEVAQLKLLMDEVFGEENFVGEIPTIMNLKGNQDNFAFADCHEYFLVYAKSINFANIGEFDVDEEEIDKLWLEDEYGLYKKGDGLRRTGDDASRNRRPKGWFPVFIAKKNQEIYITDDDLPNSNNDIVLYPINDNNEELSWSWSKSKIIKDNCNLIVTNTRSGGFNIYKKQRPQLGEIPSRKPKSVFYKSDYSTSTATTYLKNLLGAKVFKGPKPVPFIKDLLTVGIHQNDLILDFFAGSGTTADAVMQLNAEDGGNRRFILVQLPEKIDPKKNKTAYDFVQNELGVAEPTIFDITKERLIRSANKIQADNSETTEPKDLSTQDMGFKVFETLPIWDDYELEIDKFHEQITLFDQSKLTEDDIQALLITWKTFDGSPLTDDYQEYVLQAVNSVNNVESNANDSSITYTAYYVACDAGEKLYLFSTAHLTDLLQKLDSDPSFNPTSIVAFGYHFDSKHLRELSENISSFANKKSSDIDFVVRY